MNNEDDLFDMMESESASKPAASSGYGNSGGGYGQGGYGGQPKEKKKNLYEATADDVKPAKVDVSQFNKTKKTFVIATARGKDTVPEAVKEKIVEVAKILSKKGYVFRHNAGADDEVQNAVMQIEGIKAESYIPWKKFNVKVKEPYFTKSTEKAYGIGSNSHKVFWKLPNPVRAILAMNVHSMLGPKCDDPTDLLIGYSECGSESITKNMEFKKSGNLTFFLKLAEDSNVPVFNFKKEDAVQRLAAFLKKHEASTQESNSDEY
jgi:hypothetical protein